MFCNALMLCFLLYNLCTMLILALWVHILFLCISLYKGVFYMSCWMWICIYFSLLGVIRWKVERIHCFPVFTYCLRWSAMLGFSSKRQPVFLHAQSSCTDFGWNQAMCYPFNLQQPSFSWWSSGMTCLLLLLLLLMLLLLHLPVLQVLHCWFYYVMQLSNKGLYSN